LPSDVTFHISRNRACKAHFFKKQWNASIMIHKING
jgi:hypothetical protein